MTLTENGRLVMERRISPRDADGNPTETPEETFERVASAVAAGDLMFGSTPEQLKKIHDKFYRLLSSLDFLPNSPTLVNAGREIGQLSACFVIPVEDSMEDIFNAVKNAALIHKTGGGTGFSFSKLRAEGSRVDKTNGIASGPVSFMQVFDKATEVIKQGGVRRGANMGILRIDHPDIRSFIRVKDDLKTLTNFNISVAVTDAFMDALDKNARYNLIDPKTQEATGSLNANEVWQEIIQSAWKTGDPGLVFIDRINASRANPVPSLGPIEATNPCGEQPLYPYDSCNLGSINLSNFVEEQNGRPVLDGGRLMETVEDAVHFLDNVIEINKYPLPEIDKVSKAIRRIGLGVMGFADMLIKLKIRYGSNDSLEVAENIAKIIANTADQKSTQLAFARGAFPLYPVSIYKDTPIRNSTRTTIAPTGTISIIAGCSSGIEPVYAFNLIRSHYLDKDDPSKRHEMEEWHPLYEAWRLAHPNLPRPDYLVEAKDISVSEHVAMQAAWQRQVDNCVSKTINLPNSADYELVDLAYREAWGMGCNGITIYRDGCRDNQVLREEPKDEQSTISHKSHNEEVVLPDQPEQEGVGEPTPLDTLTKNRRVSISDTRPGIIHKFRIGDFKAYIIVGISDTGSPREVFIIGSKIGSTTRGYLDSIGTLISTALRNGIPVEAVVQKLIGTKFEPSGFTGDGAIPVASSILDYVGLWLRSKFSQPDTDKVFKTVHGDLCPECDAGLYYGEGCLTCVSCGYSKCG
jgi:ribonucleoside-diphosphate reductase alpha chain